MPLLPPDAVCVSCGNPASLVIHTIGDDGSTDCRACDDCADDALESGCFARTVVLDILIMQGFSVACNLFGVETVLETV